MNSSYTPSELAHQLGNCNAKVVIVYPAFLPNLLEAFKLLGVPTHETKKRVILANWKDPALPVPQGLVLLDDLLRVGKMEQEAAFDGRYADETALLCYSSGTTGRAKGVEVDLNSVSFCQCSFSPDHS